MRLASGSRVSRARFDASGLQISERMKVRAEGFELAARNIQDGLSLAKVAEDGMTAVIDQLTRIQELALQSMTGTISNQDRLALDAEVQERLGEITRLMDAVEFNGIGLLQGDSSIDLQVGPSDDAQQASQTRRLESMLDVARSSRVPLEAAASRIADADLAEETAAYARESILQQASVAVLSQAMRAPELALQLLRP